MTADQHPRTAKGLPWVAWLTSLMLALTCVGILQVSYAPTAAACSCKPFTTEELMDEADLIANVRVLSAGVSPTDKYAGEYEVALMEVWKGEQSATVTMETNFEGTACGLGELKVGEELRLWGFEHDGTYGASWCGLPNGSAEQVDAALASRFGEPWAPETIATPSPVSGFDGLSDVLPPVAIGIVAAFALLILVRG